MDNNLGMQCMEKALIDVGRPLPSNQDVSVPYLRPCASKICTSIRNVSEQKRLKLRKVLRACMDVNSAVTSEGLPENSGVEYRDFGIYFIEEQWDGHRCRGRRCCFWQHKMVTLEW